MCWKVATDWLITTSRIKRGKGVRAQHRVANVAFLFFCVAAAWEGLKEETKKIIKKSGGELNTPRLFKSSRNN